MTLCLGLMSYFSVQKRRQKNFERFWYSHHLFIVLFITWQFHGSVLRSTRRWDDADRRE